MKTKLIPVVLAAAVCLGLFAGCQSSTLRSFSEDAAAEPSPATTDTASTAKDYTPAYAAYDPDEVMLSVDGIDVTWGELFYWYEYDVSNMESYYGDITDWDAESGVAEGKTNREYVMENALDTVKHYCALESKAKDLGISLSEEDKATLETIWQNNVTSYGNGDEAAFIEYLEKNFLTKNIYDHINEVSMLYDLVLKNKYGANGEKLSEAEVVQKAADLGYVRAKHILISTKDDADTTLTGDALTEKKTTADNILKELKSITDKQALAARFDELLAEYGEDTGATYYPDGYTFMEGSNSFDSTFEEATTSLGENALSDVVQTDFGFHIILRLPLKATAVVEYTSESEQATLAYYVSQALFGAETDKWTDESKVEYTKTYNDMDIATVFAKSTRTAS